MTDPVLETPPLQSIPTQKPTILKNEPTYVETFTAQTSELFSFIPETIEAAAPLPDRDIGFNVDNFLAERGVSKDTPAGREIMRWGLNEATAERAYQTYLKHIRNQETIEQAGFVKQLLTDPVFWGEIAATGGIAAGLKASGKQVFKNLGKVEGREMLETLGRARVNEALWRKGFRIANAEAGFFEGTYNTLSLANDLSGQKEADEAVLDAMFRQVTAQGIASVLGAGVGKIGDKLTQPPQPESVLRSYQTSLQNLQELADGVKAKPTRDVVMTGDVPDVSADELLMTGEWFTESIFYRALPTPVKAVMGKTSQATSDVKLRFMGLVNDAGVSFKLNQLGKSFGKSVYQEAGELSGKWGSVYNQIHEIWGEVSPSGNYNIADMQISNTIETIQKRRGKESLTFEDFGNQVVDLYISGRKPTTDAESRAVEIIRNYFDEWDRMLNDVGLLGGTDTLVKRKTGIEGRVSSMENTLMDIVETNRNYLEKEIAKIDGYIENMGAAEARRGLTNKQLARREELLDAKARLSTALERSYNVRNVSDLLSGNQFDELVKEFSERQGEVASKLMGHINEMKSRLDNINDYLNGSGPRPGAKENFFPRYFDRRKIEANRAEFEETLTREYMNNPTMWRFDEKTKRYERVVLSSDYASANRRAKQTTDEILDLVDDDGFDDFAYFGAGRSKHLLHRKLDIPNEKLKEFMVTDLKQVLVAYNEKMAPKYAFAKKFRAKDIDAPATLDDILAQNRRDMQKAGVSEDEINRINKEFVGAYDRIVGRVITKPDTLSTRVVEWLRTATQWTYLGGAGTAAVADFANIFMDHEMKTIAKGLVSLADENSVSISKKELQKAGDGFEVIAGTYQMKFMESLSSDPFRNGMTDKINTAFYKFNLLSQVTMVAKSFDAMFRGHTIIEASQRLAENTASKWEREFLARYNITEEMAARIAAQPVQSTKNKFMLPNTDAWTDEEALSAFRSALKSGVMNRIIMGTPADKPLVMSGKTYLPMHIAKTIGMKESKRVKGYAEIESPMLALPFTFYTYTVGALNKVTANYAQGSVRNPAIHFAMAMFFGYSIVKFRTPTFAWNEMDPEDKALRAFDFSGLAALYSDVFYRSLEMGMAFDISNPTPFSPKFTEDPDAVGGVVSIFGAPADYAYGFVKSARDFVRGEYEEGTEQLVRQIPLIWNMFIKDTMNDIKNGLGSFAGQFE